MGSIPGLGRSPGDRKGYPLQYFGLENSMNYIVHGVAKSRTQLSDSHYTILNIKATNNSNLTQTIPKHNYSIISNKQQS